jgi:P27 family predicted phage terminase small subunit
LAKSTTKKADDSEFSTSPPSHLSKESAAWFKRTVALYDMDEHHLKLLTLACEAFDRAVQARKGLEQHGLTFVDRYGSRKPSPEISIEKDSRTAFARLVREIGLDLASEPKSNPPVLPANRR